MILRFHGHACFSITCGDASVCVDPFASGALGGAVELPPLPDAFTHWIATHEHVDHNAGHTIPAAQRLSAPCTVGELSVRRREAFHDEFGGRLRGGTTDVLRFETPPPVGDGPPLSVVHCGDIGERPTGELLEWLVARPIDVLIVPVGGYFTLGADGAAELTRLLRPAVVVPCHGSDQGVTLAQMRPTGPFVARLSANGTAVSTRGALDVAAARGGEPRTTTDVTVLTRDTGR